MQPGFPGGCSPPPLTPPLARLQTADAPAATQAAQVDAFADRLLAELLADSLDYDGIVYRLARYAVPDIADACMLHVIEPEAGVRLAAAAHVDPRVEETMRELDRRWPVQPGEPYWARVIESAQPMLLERVAPETIEELARDGEHARLLKGIGMRSAMTLPMRTRGRTMGCVSFILGPSARRYAPPDLEAASTFVARASILVDNARLYTQLQGAQDDLRRSRDHLRLVLDGVADGILVQDESGGLLYANDAAARAIGFASADALLRTPVDEIAGRYEILDEQGRPLDREELPNRHAMRGAPRPERVLRYRVRATGEERWSVTKARPLADASGAARGAITIFTDVTEMRRMEAENARAQGDARFRGIVQAAPDGIVGAGPDGHVVLVNAQAEALFGYSAEELIGRPADFLVTGPMRAALAGAWRAALADETTQRLELCCRRRDGGEFPAEVGLSPIRTDEGLLVIGMIRDVTDRKAAEERIAHLAYHDALTGLPNRSMLEQHLERALAAAARSGRGVGMFYIDLDEFKFVNDSLGHLAGDDLLRQVADRLRRLTRGGDLLARHGGDEFLLLADDLGPDGGEAAAAAAARIATRIHDMLREPFLLDGTEFRIGASVGVSLFPGDARDADGLLRHADAALYAGKAQGRGTSVIYASDGGAGTATHERLSLTTRLRRAVEEREFIVHYQPLVDLRTGLVTGVEALARWEDPERGIVPPLEFIPAAEGLGLIEAIGEQVIEAVCTQARAWREEGRQLTVSLNVSLRQVWRGDLAACLLEHVGRAGLAPADFVIELTESTVMTEFEGGAESLQALAAAGFRLAIDDFGTGYSSLARLSQVPVSILKIDRSFVAGLTDGASRAGGVVKSVVELARTLGLEAVAEGIENPDQWVTLLQLGCRSGQGYLFGRPVPADAVPRLPLARPA